MPELATEDLPRQSSHVVLHHVVTTPPCEPTSFHARRFAIDPRLRRQQEFTSLIESCVTALRWYQRAEAMIDLSEGVALRVVKDRDGGDLGMPFASICENEVGIRRHEAYRRIRLLDLVERLPELGVALVSGRVSKSKILTIAPVVHEGDLAEWIEIASTTPVRELKAMVTKALADRRNSPDSSSTEAPGGSEAPGRFLSASAPVSAKLALDDAFETARKVLGYDAPPWECLEAMLAEASSSLVVEEVPQRGIYREPTRAASGDLSARAARGSGERKRHRRTPRGIPRAFRRCRGSELPVGSTLRKIRQTLQQLSDEMRDLLELAPLTPPENVRGAIDRLEAVRCVSRPLRFLSNRLLRQLRDAQAHLPVGYSTFPDLIEDATDIPERTLRARLREARELDYHPFLRDAYLSGRLGMQKLLLLADRTLDPRTSEMFIERAATVTVRQLRRELRLLEHLRCIPTTRELRAVPLPILVRNGKLEARLFECLQSAGRTPSEIEQELRSHGLDMSAVWDTAAESEDAANARRWNCVPETEPEACAGSARSRCVRASRVPDPAENPLYLRRLEWLVGRALLATLEDSIEVCGEVSPTGRQTLQPDLETMQIRFWVPDLVLDQLESVHIHVRSHLGHVPLWMTLILCAEEAMREWSRHDPARKSRRNAIYTRDQYACQTPGCPNRRDLDSHHILFRSRNGSDSPKNQTTLCKRCHNAVHAGKISLRGVAPTGLEFTFGQKPRPSRGSGVGTVAASGTSYFARYRGARRIRKCR